MADRPARGRPSSACRYDAFIAKLKLAEAQVLLLAHHMDAGAFKPATPPKGLGAFKLADSSLDSEAAAREAAAAVNEFLTRVGAVAKQQHETELDAL